MSLNKCWSVSYVASILEEYGEISLVGILSLQWHIILDNGTRVGLNIIGIHERCIVEGVVVAKGTIVSLHRQFIDTILHAGQRLRQVDSIGRASDVFQFRGRSVISAEAASIGFPSFLSKTEVRIDHQVGNLATRSIVRSDCLSQEILQINGLLLNLLCAQLTVLVDVGI